MIKVDRVDISNLDVLSKIDIDNFDDAWTKDMFKSELEHANAEYYGSLKILTKTCFPSLLENPIKCLFSEI